MGGRPRTLRQESLRSPWGQVKSTKGFGNFAIPTSGSPGVLGHGEQLWKKKNLGVFFVIFTYKKKKKSAPEPNSGLVATQE